MLELFFVFIGGGIGKDIPNWDINCPNGPVAKGEPSACVCASVIFFNNVIHP
jgi:hypothetical protein